MSLTYSFIRRAVNRRLHTRDDAKCTAVWRRDLARSLTIRHQRGEFSAALFNLRWQ